MAMSRLLIPRNDASNPWIAINGNKLNNYVFVKLGTNTFCRTSKSKSKSEEPSSSQSKSSSKTTKDVKKKDPKKRSKSKSKDKKAEKKVEEAEEEPAAEPASEKSVEALKEPEKAETLSLVDRMDRDRQLLSDQFSRRLQAQTARAVRFQVPFRAIAVHHSTSNMLRRTR